MRPWNRVEHCRRRLVSEFRGSWSWSCRLRAVGWREQCHHLLGMIMLKVLRGSSNQTALPHVFFFRGYRTYDLKKTEISIIFFHDFYNYRKNARFFEKSFGKKIGGNLRLFSKIEIIFIKNRILFGFFITKFMGENVTGDSEPSWSQRELRYREVRLFPRAYWYNPPYIKTACGLWLFFLVGFWTKFDRF